MQGYLGEKILESDKGTPFEGFTPVQWALTYIERYGGIDGDHHKTWVLDQVARILNGTPIKIKLASWDNGRSAETLHQEYRFTTDEPSVRYNEWVQSMLGEYDEETQAYEYDYDTGIAP